MSKSFPIGAAVLITGRPCSIRNFLGLYGFVEKIVEDRYIVQVLLDPELGGEYAINERKHGRYDHTTIAFCKDDDIISLKGKAKIARVNRFRAHIIKKKANEKVDPVWEAKLKQLTSQTSIDKHNAYEEALKKRSAEMGAQFRVAGYVKRGDKSHYPAYRDADVKAIESERNGYAATHDLSTLSIDAKVRWRQANEILDQTSFLPSDPDIRALVKELDLDPFLDGHARNLYKKEESVYVSRANLRREAIKLWNKGAVFTSIYQAADKDTCWNDYDNTKGLCPGFILYYGFRRKLPIPA